jgi:putative flippase GtrA
MSRERIREILRFVIAGGAGFAVEIGALILLKEKLGMDTLIATPIAFTISVIVNYLICVLWVFRGAREQNRKNQIAFFLTSAVGLALNEVLMLLFRVAWGEEKVLFTVFSFAVSLYVLNKVLATCIVMIWNYWTKRRILTGGGAGG